MRASYIGGPLHGRTDEIDAEPGPEDRPDELRVHEFEIWPSSRASLGPAGVYVPRGRKDPGTIAFAWRASSLERRAARLLDPEVPPLVAGLSYRRRRATAEVMRLLARLDLWTSPSRYTLRGVAIAIPTFYMALFTATWLIGSIWSFREEPVKVASIALSLVFWAALGVGIDRLVPSSGRGNYRPAAGSQLRTGQKLAVRAHSRGRSTARFSITYVGGPNRGETEVSEEAVSDPDLPIDGTIFGFEVWPAGLSLLGPTGRYDAEVGDRAGTARYVWRAYTADERAERLREVATH